MELYPYSFHTVSSHIRHIYLFLPDVLECCKDLDETEWILILGVTRTHRYNSNSSWEQYVAAVVGSFLIKVLQDDRVFAILGGESLESREHSALSLFAQQESFSITGIAKKLEMKIKSK